MNNPNMLAYKTYTATTMLNYMQNSIETFLYGLRHTPHAQSLRDEEDVKGSSVLEVSTNEILCVRQGYFI
jgi:hypothetical protein